MPPESPSLRGKEAIQGWLEAAADIPGFSVSWEPIEAHIATSGDLAYLIERNVGRFDGPDGSPVVTHGKVVTIWRKDADDSWKNVVDIWNPAPPPR